MHTDSNPLTTLTSFEKALHKVDVEQEVKVHFSDDGKSLQVIHRGLEFYGQIERPLIHQLGCRAWGQKKTYAEIERRWKKGFLDNRNTLASELAEVFKDHDLTIHYYRKASGRNFIYGVVSPDFIEVNQQDFREQFLATLGSTIPLKPRSGGITLSRSGQVIEVFDFNTPGFQTKYSYRLVYARNNGYEAYKVNWGREVVICKNGLTTWKGSNFSWRHTRQIDLDDFIRNTIDAGVANQSHLEGRIHTSRETALQQPLFNELLARLSLARTTKNRIASRLAIETKEVGENEWALSQSCTWLGNHGRHIPIGIKLQLITLGTTILEQSLRDTLRIQVTVDRSGHYGILLPPELSQTAHA